MTPGTQPALSSFARLFWLIIYLFSTGLTHLPAQQYEEQFSYEPGKNTQGTVSPRLFNALSTASREDIFIQVSEVYNRE